MRTNTDFYKAAPFYRDERVMEPLGTIAMFVVIAAVVVTIAVLGFHAPLGKSLFAQGTLLAVVVTRVFPDLADGIDAHLAWRRRCEASNARRNARLAA